MSLRRRLSGFSIATRTALILSLAIGMLFAVTGVLVFRDARAQLLADALGELDAFNREVAEQQEHRFQTMIAAHGRAGGLLAGEVAARDRIGQSDFDRLFPRRQDGSRRSADGLFDGADSPIGYVRGLGAILPGDVAHDRQPLMTAAARVVHGVGEGAEHDLKSLYFFTPDNALIIFAPGRSDRLAYYRREAPADFEFQREEFAAIATPARNPARTTMCTDLRRILYDRTGRTWTIGCVTPFDIAGRHVGAFGTSIMLDDLLATGPLEALPSTALILVSREGRMIAHSDHMRQSRPIPDHLFDLTRTHDAKLGGLWTFLNAQRADHFVGYVPALDQYVAMRRIATPGWYAISVQPGSVIRSSAMRPVARVAITATICLTLQALLLFVVLNRQVRRPLRRLTQDVRDLARQFDDPSRAVAHDDAGADEVEQLEADFRLMSEQVVSAHDRLEAEVADRTRSLSVANAELTRLSDIDPLTSVSNRRRLIAVAGRMIAERLEGRRVYAILFDIDHFKRINDGHGHAVGDTVLVAVAETARGLLRDGDEIGRLGGEEFLVLLHARDDAQATEIAERIRLRLKGLSVPAPGGSVSLTVSLGIAAVGRERSFAALYRHADEAMYAAKSAGRDRSMLHAANTGLRAA